MKNIKTQLFWPPEILAHVFDYALTDLAQLQTLLTVRNQDFHTSFFYYIQSCEKKHLKHLFNLWFPSQSYRGEMQSTLDSLSLLPAPLKHRAIYTYLFILLFYFSSATWLKTQLKQQETHVFQFSDCLKKNTLRDTTLPHILQIQLKNSLFFNAAVWKYSAITSQQKMDMSHIRSLSACNLSEMNLENITIKKIDMHGVSLRKANLSRTFFMWVNLKNADLEGADLQCADLWGTRLEEANLQNTDLSGAQLQSTNLKYTNLCGASLYDTNMEDANLTGANLKNTNLRWAHLKNTNFGHANLEGVQFSETFHQSVTLQQLLQMIFRKNNLKDKPFLEFFEKALNNKIEKMQIVATYDEHELYTLINIYFHYRSALPTYTGNFLKNSLYSFFQPYLHYSKEEKLAAAKWLLNKLKNNMDFDHPPKALQQGMLGKIFLLAQKNFTNHQICYSF